MARPVTGRSGGATRARLASTWVPLARRQLLHEPLKLGLAMAGVALAVALVGLLFGLREGIKEQVTTYEDNAGADVYVSSREVRSFATPGPPCRSSSAAG